MCQPYRSVGDSERALATPPGADHDGVVSLHGDDSVKLQDAVSVRIAVRGRVDVLGVRAGMSGELLLPVDHAIVRSEMPCHTPPLLRQLLTSVECRTGMKDGIQSELLLRSTYPSGAAECEQHLHLSLGDE